VPSATLPSEAPADLFVAFAGGTVAICALAPLLREELAAMFGPMVVPGPRGQVVGTVAATSSSAGFVIRSDASEELESEFQGLSLADGLYHAAMRLLMLARRDLAWLHAGVVGRGGAAQVLCGPSGAGKSTLVGALIERGWTYLSDDVAPLDACAATVYPFPIAPERRTHQGMPLPEVAVRRLPKMAIRVEPGAIAQGALPVAAIHVLRFRPGHRSLERRRYSPASAVLELLRNSLSLGLDRAGEIAALARLAGGIPTCELVYGDAEKAAEHLDRAVVAALPRLASRECAAVRAG
jgi:hypothetical protein